MTSSLQTRSADIIPFPAGGRAALRERSWNTAKQEARDTLPHVVFDGWYHEQAIQDEQERRGH